MLGSNISFISAVSVLVCLGSLGWCILLLRRVRLGKIRYFVAFTGALCIYHASRLLAGAGVVKESMVPNLGQASEVVMTTMYLAAVAILEFYMVERTRLQYKLRLVEAAESPPPQPFHMEDPQHAQAMYRAMSDACPLPVYAITPSGKVCYWNAAAERVLGFARSEVIGKPLGLEIHKVGSDAVRVQRKDGQPVEATVWSAQYRTPGHEIYGTLTILATRSTSGSGLRPVLTSAMEPKSAA